MQVTFPGGVHESGVTYWAVSVSACHMQAILELAELGVLDELKDKWMRSKLCEQEGFLKAADVTAPQLNTSSFRGLYYMLFIFAILSVLWTGLEHGMQAFLSR